MIGLLIAPLLALCSWMQSEMQKGDRDVPLPPTEMPAPDYAPIPVRLEHERGASDRLARPGQTVSFPFASEAGELSLFALESYGYALGWRSGARVRVRDAASRVLCESSRDGPSVWHEVTAFVAPSSGMFFYDVESVGQPFRYRIVRHSCCATRDDRAVPLGDVELVHSYLASAVDVARFSIDLDAGEEVFLKASNTESAGRAERRAVNPPRQGLGSIGGFVYPTFELAVSIGEDHLLGHVRSAFLRAPRTGTYVVEVAANAPGAAGLFDLEARRRVPKITVHGSVRDREDAPLAGARLTFLHGIDRDVVGAVRAAADGSFTIEVPPGRLRIRVEGVPVPAEIDALVDEPRELVLVP